ncbi:MAG: hypothetical protein EXR07_19065 [Acetobacteraceae bacterium]|nr:hypothetical protein [Acetobacteraceae bacterium]
MLDFSNVARPAIRGLCFGALMTLTCCTSTTMPDPGPVQSRPISAEGGEMLARAQLTFFDADAFDLSLSQSLSGKPELVGVAFAAPTSLNALPPRINAWLTEIKRSDGRIRMAALEPNPGRATRGLGAGIVFDIVDVIMSAPERRARATRLASVRAYDATIMYDKVTGTAKEVWFLRRGI